MRIQEIIKSNIELEDSKKIILNIIYTSNFVGEQFNEILKPYELSSEQYNVLRILRGQKNKPVNMNEIQERMIAKNSNTTRLIDKLLLKELVTRNVCPNNRRKIEIVITKKGIDILSFLDDKVVRHEKSFSENLSNNEQKQLIELLEKYRTQK